MEDQRNWTDASYKTYVRPLALPWPYTIPKDEAIDQRVMLTVSGSASRIASNEKRYTVVVGQPASGKRMPPLGFGLHPKDLAGVEQNIDVIKEARPSHIVCHYDPRYGHNQNDLKRMAALGPSIGTDLWLEFVIPSVDRFVEDINAAGRAVSELKNPFSTVLVSPAPDLKCTLPGSPWPPCPPLDKCYQAVRNAFPGVKLGGGMFSFFTELNRKRPPLDLLDLVTFTTVAIFHAGDDRSAMEGLESLPYLAKTVRSFIGDKPYHVGPSAIGLRMNPYGEAPMPNPHNIRQAMNGMDPRQRGLFAAAWSIGFVARFAKGGASALTVGGGAGEFGITSARMDYPQPWFDGNGGVYPVYHAIKGLARLRDDQLMEVEILTPDELQAIATKGNSSIELWITNLTDQTKNVELIPKLIGGVTMLSAAEFERATTDLAIMDSLEKRLTGEKLVFPPYAIARVRGST
jgi:D-apionolactonase